jgi:hypothetical protein
MEFNSNGREFNKFRQRFTPNKELRSEEDSVNFSFADWKPALIKRSPSSFEVSRRPLIKDFYVKEQRKLFKVHRSFDCRKKENLQEVNVMNNFIKRIINQHCDVKQPLVFNKGAKKQESFQHEILDNNDSTPHFLQIKNKQRFPRHVFSLNSKKRRSHSKF